MGRIDPIIEFRPTSNSVDDSVDRDIFSVWRWICCEQEGSPIAEGTRGGPMGVQQKTGPGDLVIFQNILPVQRLV